MEIVPEVFRIVLEKGTFDLVALVGANSDFEYSRLWRRCTTFSDETIKIYHNVVSVKVVTFSGHFAKLESAVC